MSTPDLFSLSPPPGAPDVTTLARLAGELFSALPGAWSSPSLGGSPVPANPQPPGVSIPPGVTGPSTASAAPFGATAPGANLTPTSPQSPANAVASSPSLAPHAQAPNGVPDHALVAAPGFDGRWGSHLQGVPEAHAAHGPVTVVPAAGVADPVLALSPFYFLSEADGASGASPSAAPTGFYFIDSATPSQPGASGTPQASSAAHPPFDVHAIRRDFPILQERVNGRQLVWFDNAATTQKPQAVIDRLAHFYAHENSNIHRAAHELAARATDAYEGARETVRRFIGAGSVDEIIFVRGCTEGINLVAKSWGAKNIGPGDEIVVSHLEHHANIVPWHFLRERKGAVLKWAPMTDAGELSLEHFEHLLTPKTKMVAITHLSNVLGTVLPIKQIVRMAHAKGIPVLVDGSQSAAHMPVDVRDLDCDFFVFTGHKTYGPTGIGVLYAKKRHLDALPPYEGGGDMIETVTVDTVTYNKPPHKFEPGTPPIVEAIGLAAGLNYMMQVGREKIARHEAELAAYANERLSATPWIKLYGTAPGKGAIFAFTVDGLHPHDVSTIIDRSGVAIRAGHHCAQPLMERLGVTATCRASFAMYNTKAEVDALMTALTKAHDLFA